MSVKSTVCKREEGIRQHAPTYTNILFDYSFLPSYVFSPLLHSLPFLCVSDDGKVVFDLFSSNNTHVKASRAALAFQIVSL